MIGVFDDFLLTVYPHNYDVSIHVGRIVGGTPTDPDVASGWIKSRVSELPKDDIIRDEVAKVMLERGVEMTEALEAVNSNRHLNGFRRDENGLYIEGRQAKAMLKENFNIYAPKAKWGPSNKGTMSFIAEHLFVVEDKIHLGVDEPSDIQQRFVHTWRGTGIQLEEVVDDAVLNFTVTSDFEFTREQWANVWLRAQNNGIGASRSQGFGKFTVIKWDAISKAEAKKRAA